MTLAEPITESSSADARCLECVMRTWDGTELFYRVWTPPVPTTKALLLFHRGHEHSGRYAELVRELGLHDAWVFAWDARGHGRSPGERGDAPSFAAVVKDMDTFARHVAREYGVAIEDTVVIGHSVGAVAVAAWVHDYGRPTRAMVLVTPAFRVKLYVPFALPALRARLRMGGKSFITSYVRPRMLTHDPVEAERYASDPLISRNIATHILVELHDTATRLLADAGGIDTPTLLLSAGSDWVVKNAAQRRFFERLSSPVKQMATYAGFRHALLHEKDRREPIARIREFVLDAFQRSTPPPSGLDADQQGYTHREYERLAKPGPWYCPKRWSFAMQRTFLKTVGRLSHGIRLGWRRGFDSGESLDHIYGDRARGITPLGKLIDRIYLNAAGWRGIRRRKTLVQGMMRRAIDDVQASREAVRIVDVAAGGGRYVLEVLRELRDEARSRVGSAVRTDSVQAMLRDFSTDALDIARRTAHDLGLANVTFAQGDAFDRASLAAIQPRPNIAVVSGLYELFGDNRMVLESLRGLADAMEPGSLLIYTNQPWHPQVEMIARVLTNHRGQPWVMRRRTQAEMDRLVAEAGFEKLDMEIESAGIFTVSLARRK